MVMKRCRRMRGPSPSPGSMQCSWTHRRRKFAWSQLLLHSIVVFPSTLALSTQQRNSNIHNTLRSTQATRISRSRRRSYYSTQLQAHRKLGDSALQQVQKLASSVAESTAAASVDRPNNVEGIGGPVYANGQYSSYGLMTPYPSSSVAIRATELQSEQVWKALANLERDS